MSKHFGPARPAPMARSPAVPTAPLESQQTLEEDEPFDPMLMAEAENIGSPMAQALLQQAKALQAIMSHFHSTSTDPMSDLSSSTPTPGIKGTMVVQWSLPHAFDDSSIGKLGPRQRSSGPYKGDGGCFGCC